jgi:poly(beta-D-mannuronate) lyase
VSSSFRLQLPAFTALPLCALLACLVTAISNGETISVENRAQLKSLSTMKPGDVAILKNGIWENVPLTIVAGGTAEKPVTIKAETPGKVTLTGHSTLLIRAPFIVVDGLLFTSGAIDKGSVIRFESHHGTVRNTAIVDYNPATFDTKYYWVYFEGDYNVVDRCYFKGKNHLEPLVGNAIENSRHNTVSHCYFKDIPYAAANGREILRIWGSGKFEERPEDGAWFTIEANLFDHADGEGAEIVSLKSNHNQVLRNTIIATRGGINIRRGDFNLIQENVVLGGNVEGAHGLRMSGAHNTVQGNYVSGCEYGIRVSCGEFIDGDLTGSYKPDIKGKGKKENSVIPNYPQVKDLTLSGNTVVDCSGPDLEIGSSYKRRWPESQQILLPEECVIKNNRFVRPKGGASVMGTIPDRNPPLDRFAFKPNTYVDNQLIGGTNGFPPAAGGCQTTPFPGIWYLATVMGKLQPLTPADVGPDWMHGH